MSSYVADWKARLRSRFYEQFKNSTNLLALADLCAVQAQALEDAGRDLFTLPSIDDSEGVQLDRIGQIVGQARAGVADATYRLYLHARIAANKSSGTTDEIYSVFFAMLGAGLKADITPGFPAEMVLRIELPVLTANEAAVGVAFLTDAKAAGVRAILEWQGAIDALMFYTERAGFLGSNHLAGVSALFGRPGDYAGFPPSGTLLLAAGVSAIEDTADYSSISIIFGDVPVWNLTAPTAHAYPERTSVALSGSTGLGFGDTGNAAVGGELAGAIQA